MYFKKLVKLALLFQLCNATLKSGEKNNNNNNTEQLPQNEAKMDMKDLDNPNRSKRQSGYGDGMWNGNGGADNGNMGNWNNMGNMGNGFGNGPQGPPPDDSIKGSVGTGSDKSKNKTDGQSNTNSPNGNMGPNEMGNGGQGPWWPNGGQNSYNNGPGPMQPYNGGNGGDPNFPSNGFPNNGVDPNFPPNGSPSNGVDSGIKGSVGTKEETTQKPYPPNGYGNRYGGGYENGNGMQNGNGFSGGFQNGYGPNRWGRPLRPRGDRFRPNHNRFILPY